MKDIKQSIKGNNNKQNVTNVENMYILGESNEILTKSDVSELLDIFWSADRNGMSDYDVSKLPDGVLKKLSYNNAERYEKHFENHTIDYIIVKQVMDQYANSESIVCFIRDYYIKAAAFEEAVHDSTTRDGDACLDLVFSNIKNHILKSKNYNKELSEQKIESFCYGLLQYCISKCKVLEPVPELTKNSEEARNATS